MAGFACVLCIDMSGTLTTGGNSIVATNAIGCKPRVIHGGAYPLCGAMTNVTILRGQNGHVIRGHTSRNNTIMTTQAGADNLSMVYL